MVVFLVFYVVLYVVELLAYLAMIIYCCKNKNDVLLVLTRVTALINLFKIPMEIQMDKSYVLSIALVIFWFVVALIIALKLGRDD